MLLTTTPTSDNVVSMPTQQKQMFSIRITCGAHCGHSRVDWEVDRVGARSLAERLKRTYEDGDHTVRVVAVVADAR